HLRADGDRELVRLLPTTVVPDAAICDCARISAVRVRVGDLVASHPARTRLLSLGTTSESTSGSTGLSPPPSSRCSLLQRHRALVAAPFSCLQSPAAVPPG